MLPNHVFNRDNLVLILDEFGNFPVPEVVLEAAFYCRLRIWFPIAENGGLFAENFVGFLYFAALCYLGNFFLPYLYYLPIVVVLSLFFVGGEIGT